MSGYLEGMDQLQLTTALDFLSEVSVMRWYQESSNQTPCNRLRAQALDNLRLLCQTSLHEAFQGFRCSTPC